MIVSTAILVLALLSFTYILFSKWKRQYWSKQGVPQLNPHFIFGDYRPLIGGSVSINNFFFDLYKSSRAKGYTQVGLYNFLTPEWVPVDINIIKTILTKDFQYFTGHGFYHHKNEPLTMNLFQADGDEWKKMRTRLTPTFTSGKMKNMFETLIEKAHVLEQAVGKCAGTNQEVDIKETMARFGTDVIGSVAFGIECNSLIEPNNQLREIGRQAFDPNMFKLLAERMIPRELLGNLGYKSIYKEVTSYFTDVVSETINYREKQNIQRKDFIQLMLQLKNQGYVTSDGGKHFITNQEIITEAFLFFLAGFETSSTTTTFTLIELAHHPDIQEKLREEILSSLEENGGKPTYDSISEMKYLDKVVHEALRKYPPVAVLPRECTKNYKVPGSNLVIRKGTKVHIPTWGIHKDPEYYPNPEEFNPENFSPENAAKRPDFAWLPFGEGPRMCLGLRFGMMQVKVGIITLLKNFKFSHHEATKFPVEFEKASLVLSVKGKAMLKVEKL